MALVAAFILIAVALNGGLGQSVSRRIEYPELLTAIREDNVKAVAIRGTSLVGLYRNGTVADADFPERGYDFETTIGSDFIDTVRQMTATPRENPGRGQRERPALYRGVPRARGHAVVYGVLALYSDDRHHMAAWYFIMARRAAATAR